MSIENDIRAAARRIGFPLCGFAPVAVPPHAAFVRQWLADGNAADMHYIERGLAKRLDPRLILPEARSVITVGYRYRPPPVPPIDWQQQLRGRVAAYALGTDYHVTINGKLRELAAWIAGRHPGALARAYVDTGPVLEREWAVNAGVGWFGKNTNVLHTEEGSWFFLGEIFTNMELVGAAPVADHCGTCTRCLDLCPTQALRPGYVLDARLCISYLTIEHRGAIPVALRSQLGNWIFGCDVCQEVCPWNERHVRRRDVLAASRNFQCAATQRGTVLPNRRRPQANETLLPYLRDLLQLGDAAFQSRFANTAVRRAKRDGFVRNVAIALGNTRNPAAAEPLARAVRHDPAPLVRSHAAWALGMIGTAAARRALEAARCGEIDRDVRGEIEAALAMRNVDCGSRI